jgi:hypothetical protein
MNVKQSLVKVFLTLCFATLFAGTASADVEVFPIRSINPQQVLETVRTELGDRAQVDLVQQKLVVVGDAKALSDTTMLLRKIDRLPANLRLTLTEIPANTTQDGNTTTYSADKNSQIMDTVEGAQLSLDYTKFHQQVETNGWMFSINDVPVAVRQLELRVTLLNAHAAQIVMTYARYENQERKVFGRIVAGELGSWIPLLPELTPPTNNEKITEYTSGQKPGEQLYVKVEKVLVPTKRAN